MDTTLQNTHAQKNLSVSAELKRSALCVALSAAVGGTPLAFGALPFGFALLGAAGAQAPAIFAGLCISLLRAKHPLPLLVSYAVCLLARLCFFRAGSGDGGLVLFGRRFFGEHVSVRAVCAATGAFCYGLWQLAGGGFLYYHLFGALITIILAFAAALLWYCLPILNAHASGSLLSKNAALVSVCAAAVWGLRGISLYGISASVFVCMTVSLIILRKKGLICACFAALLGGLCVSASYAPLFVFGTVCYAFIGAASPLLGCVCSFAVGMAWGIYIDGLASLSALLPALLAANFLFFIVDRLLLSTAPEPARQTEQESTQQDRTPISDMVLGARFDDTASRIKLLCESFSSLSDSLLQMPALTEHPLEGINARYCADSLIAEIGEIAEAGEWSGVPFTFSDSEAVLRTQKLALDFRIISDYLACAMVENSRSFGINSELGERIAKEIQEKLPNKSFCVCALGDSDKRIIVSAARSRELVDNRDTLRRIVSRVCGFATRTLPAYEDENGAYMMIVRDCVLRAHVSGKCRGASGEGGVCGDSFGTLNAPDGRHTYAYISDGMGSGAAAARTSEICSLFLRNLLPANFGSSNVDSTLELLNSFLCAQNGTGRAECSSTVDLCCLDLLDCRAQFFKCGAAPTYVFRDGSLFKIHSRTVPIGIIKQPDIGRVSMDLLPGDVIVLVSDGVTEGREECPELFEYLRSRLLTHDSDDLADAIMKYAEEQGCEDDVSAVVIRITERPLSDFLCDE